MGQPGFFDLSRRYQGLDGKQDRIAKSRLRHAPLGRARTLRDGGRIIPTCAGSDLREGFPRG